MSHWSEDLQIARMLADAADMISIKAFGRTRLDVWKADGSPVTRADLAIESRLREMLGQHRTNDGILGEEFGHSGALSGRIWIIDPLDHTRHFVRGNPEYGTLIALTQDNTCEVGVVSAPSLGRRWYGARGLGAHFNGAAIRVSETRDLRRAHIGVAGIREWVESSRWTLVRELLNTVEYVFGCAGGFLPAMLVAEGVLDAFIEPWGSVWDHAASAAIVGAAGGRTTDLNGSCPRGGSMLSTNGLLHDVILEFFN